MIHTYSLIHDDLPAMDNDDLRRGRETCHKKFDEATAILAGDVLQTLAFQAVAEDENLTESIRIKLISELAKAAGTPLLHRRVARLSRSLCGWGSDLGATQRAAILPRPHVPRNAPCRRARELGQALDDA